MRTIKFRGKTIKGFRWIIGDLLSTPGNTGDGVAIQYWDEEDGWMFEDVRAASVGQFVGLYDNMKREIYEDDIVRTKIGVYRIAYQCGQWVLIESNGGWLPLEECESNLGIDSSTKMEVIGNMQDNPELLE